MAGLALALPAVLVLVAGAVLVAVLAATAARGDRLLGTVAAARRHGTATGAAAVVCGLGAAVAVGASDLLRPLGSGVPELAVPLAFAVVHTAVVLAGEATWPRPRGAVRRAALTPRAPAGVAPRRLHRLLLAAAATTAGAAAVGWATADGSGRAVSVLTRDEAGQVVGGAGAGPYPGVVFALPALVGTALVVVLVELGLRLVAQRAAVAGADPADERALRRASAHRLLRGACAGQLALLGGLLAFGGTAVRSAASPTAYAVGDVAHTASGPAGVAALGLGTAPVGVLCVLAGLVVLLLPAPRVHAGAPLVRAASPRGAV